MGIRRRIERWMHQSRHRRTKKRLGTSGTPRSILVICRGNICRSPYLAALLQDWLPDVDVSSAGLIAPGQPVPEHATTVASRRGLNLSSHRSRVVTGEMIAAAGLIIVMEPGQAAYLRREFAVSPRRVVLAADLDPVYGDGRTIRDPWRQPIAVFEGSYRRLDRCAAILTEIFSSPRLGHQA